MNNTYNKLQNLIKQYKSQSFVVSKLNDLLESNPNDSSLFSFNENFVKAVRQKKETAIKIADLLVNEMVN